jgi:hypothetical protein
MREEISERENNTEKSMEQKAISSEINKPNKSLG